MSKWMLFCALFAMVLPPLSQALGQSVAVAKVCVLNMERKQHPFTSVLHGVFDSAAKSGSALIIDQAVPVELLHCVDWGATEIIIVAHSNESELNRSTLYYFKEIEEKDRAEVIAHEFDVLRSSETKFKSERERKSRLTKLEKISKSKTIYFPPKPFLPVAFEALATKLATERTRTGTVRLQEIRISSCHPESVQARYAGVFAQIQAAGNVTFDFAPVNLFWSKIKGVKDGVSLNRRWLTQK